MSFCYLWKYRTKPQLFSKAWGKAWAKRIVSFPGLIRVIVYKSILELSGAHIGSLTVVGHCVIFGRRNRLTIGKESALGRVKIALHDEVIIGDRVVINDDTTLLTASHDVNDVNWKNISKPIRIDDYAWIAEGATILPGVHIGQGAVVGAGAVVSKDIPEFGIVVGNPARSLDKRRIKNLDYSPVALVACYEAWLGKNAIKSKKFKINEKL